MSPNEIQREKAQFKEIRANDAGAVIVDLMAYDNPPVVYEDNQLVTKYYVDNVTIGGGSRPPQIIDIAAGEDDPYSIAPPSGGYNPYAVDVYYFDTDINGWKVDNTRKYLSSDLTQLFILTYGEACKVIFL